MNRLIPSMPVTLRDAMRYFLMAACFGFFFSVLLPWGDASGTGWAAVGIAYPLALTYGPIAGLGVGIGSVFGSPGDWHFGAPTWSTLLSTTFGPGLAIPLQKWLGTHRPITSHLQEFARFSTLSLGIAAFLAALLKTQLTTWHPPFSAPWLRYLGTEWCGAGLSLLLFTPLLQLLLQPQQPAASGLNLRHLIDSSSLCSTALLIVAYHALLPTDLAPYPLLFAYILITMRLALRATERGLTVTLPITALMLTASHRPMGAEAPPHLPALLLIGIVAARLLWAACEDKTTASTAQPTDENFGADRLFNDDRSFYLKVEAALSASDRPNYGLIELYISNLSTLSYLCGTAKAVELEKTVSHTISQTPALIAVARLSEGRFAVLIQAESVTQVRSTARELYTCIHDGLIRTDSGNLRLQLSVGGLLVDKTASVKASDCLLSLSDAVVIASTVQAPKLFVEPLSQATIDNRRAQERKSDCIREAIQNEHFKLYAQRIADPEAPLHMLAYEILTRLEEPDGNLVFPPEFLSLAIQSQMTPVLDRGVIRMLFSWLKSHPDALAKTYKCSVNLSGLTVSDPTIMTYIREQREKHQIPAGKIIFEITEYEAIRNPSAATTLIGELKKDGFSIALDDFGSGLSTFENLKRFPIDYLKIDGSFVKNVTHSLIDEEIVSSTARVAKRLNIRTVAEHVHNQEICDRLAEMGISCMQGEIVGKTQPLDVFFKTSTD